MATIVDDSLYTVVFYETTAQTRAEFAARHLF